MVEIVTPRTCLPAELAIGLGGALHGEYVVTLRVLRLSDSYSYNLHILPDS